MIVEDIAFAGVFVLLAAAFVYFTKYDQVASQDRKDEE